MKERWRKEENIYSRKKMEDKESKKQEEKRKHLYENCIIK
jgi:hypothetical protein